MDQSREGGLMTVTILLITVIIETLILLMALYL